MKSPNTRNRALVPFMLVMLLMGSACAAMRAAKPETAAVPDVPASLSVPAAPEGYKINPLDLLEISVYQEPDLAKVVRVSQDGYISFPLIGKVKVAGCDVIAAEEKIERLLEKDYLVNPSVTVFVKEYNVKNVYIMGAVKTPGSYPIPQDRGLTVLESIALAGGFSSVAALDNTKIIRVEDGVKKYIEVKISDITRRGDKSKDLPLKPNDIVFVPERLF